MPRLFFALSPTEQVRARILALAATLPSPDGRATRDAKIHLTLAFLGDADAVAALHAGERAAASTSAFDFALDATDSFPGATWILRAPPTPFAPLLAALTRELHATGLRAPDERRAFVPHVTLRRRAQARLPRAAIEPIAWRAGTMCLYDSDLHSGDYRRLGEWPLLGDDVSP
jgi:2'-5' RNA ligase